MYFFNRYFWCQVICFMWNGFTLKIGKLAPVTNFFCCLYIFRFTFNINCCNILKIFSFFKVSVISGLQFQLGGDLTFSVFFVRRDNRLEDWILVCCLHKKVGFSVFKGISKALSGFWAWRNWRLWPCAHLCYESKQNVQLFFFCQSERSTLLWRF